MTFRIVAGAIALAIVFGAIWADAAMGVAWCFGGLTLLGAVVGSHEVCVMARRTGVRPWTGFAIAGTVALVLIMILRASHRGSVFADVPLHAVWLGFVMAVLLAWLVRGRGPEDIADVAVTIFVSSYLGGLAAHLVALEGLRFPALVLPRSLAEVPQLLDPPGLRPSAGAWALVWTLATAKSADIFAYFTGKAVGRRPLAPEISPKKTIEGALGGLVGSVVVGLALKPLAGSAGASLSWGATIGFALCCSAACQLGDLVESRLKRRAGVKDSGAFLPEYGGFLDMVDGLIFAAPVGYAFLSVCGDAAGP